MDGTCRHPLLFAIGTSMTLWVATRIGGALTVTGTLLVLAHLH